MVKENVIAGSVAMDENERLIELVKQYPVLYDRAHQKYTDNTLRTDVWNAIALKCKFKNATSCKLKWNSLRDNYRKHLLRCRAQRAQGKQLTEHKYAHLLEFLTVFYDTCDDESAGGALVKRKATSADEQDVRAKRDPMSGEDQLKRVKQVAMSADEQDVRVKRQSMSGEEQLKHVKQDAMSGDEQLKRIMQDAMSGDEQGGRSDLDALIVVKVETMQACGQVTKSEVVSHEEVESLALGAERASTPTTGAAGADDAHPWRWTC